MESGQSGLLERLRAQRETMQSGGGTATAPAPTSDVAAVGALSLGGEADEPPPQRYPHQYQEQRQQDESGPRVARLESGQEELTRRLDGVEASIRDRLGELRNELPGIITTEVLRYTTPTNEAVADLGSRMGRMETEFTRERERWANVVTSFDQRLDQRLRSFRQDVTVMLTGMAVLILAMLLLLLLRR